MITVVRIPTVTVMGELSLIDIRLVWHLRKTDSLPIEHTFTRDLLIITDFRISNFTSYMIKENVLFMYLYLFN